MSNIPKIESCFYVKSELTKRGITMDQAIPDSTWLALNFKVTNSILLVPRGRLGNLD